MNKKRFPLFKFAAIVGISMSGLLLNGCADDLTEERTTTAAGSEDGQVEFTMIEAGNPEVATTRSIAPAADLRAEDLAPQKLPVTSTAGGDGCMIETTIAGIVTQQSKNPETRANVSTTVGGDFSTFGYKGTSASTISKTPNYFYNAKTRNDGIMYDEYKWSPQYPDARFYAISPYVDGGNDNIKLSDQNYAGTPYIDYTSPLLVTDQKDLMTACTGLVHYDAGAYKSQGVTPKTTLHFRHALTAINFAVGQNLSWNKIIDRVEIRGAMSKGRYTLTQDMTGTGATWSALSNPATFKLDGINVSTSKSPNTILMGQDGDNYTFYMIPQKLDNVSVVIHFTDNTEINAKLKGEWKAGTTKTYKLSNSNSNWDYILTSTSPTGQFNDMTTNFFVTSYRQSPDGTKQAVPFETIGYDSNKDGKFSMNERPQWIQTINVNGTGSMTGQTFNAKLIYDNVDRLKLLNDSLRTTPLKGSASQPYNLATKGGKTLMNTANCYPISSGGYYEIPLVYGNAIKNGQPNPSSYTSSRNEANILKTFVDHADKPITDPWITKTNNGVNIPDGAKLVWTDVKDIVQDLSIVGTGENARLRFRIPQEKIENGNAVIAVTKGGVTLWSWHLWFITDYATERVLVTNTYDKHSYYISEENIGTKYVRWVEPRNPNAQPDTVYVKVRQKMGNSNNYQESVITIVKKENTVIREASTTLYQWGCKNAYPGGPYNINQLGGKYEVVFKEVNPTIGERLKNPELYLAPAKGKEKNFVIDYTNLWSSNYSYNEPQNSPVIKTIYDPSPVGFHVPPRRYYSFVSKSKGSDNITCLFKDLDKAFNYDGLQFWGMKYFVDEAQKRSVYLGRTSSLEQEFNFYWSDYKNPNAVVLWSAECKNTKTNQDVYSTRIFINQSIGYLRLAGENSDIFYNGNGVRPVAELNE